MKKNFFKIGLYLFIICRCASLWAAPDLFGNYSQYFSYENETFTTGLKACFSFAEGRFAIDTKGNYNFGISVFSDNYLKTFPLKCQVGNLSIGGIISKLNNPMIDSSVSGFGGCYSDPDVITSSLPSYTSFSKPFSTFVEAGWKNEKTALQEITLNGTYIPKTKDFAMSTKVKFNFTDNFGIINTFGFSIFKLEENVSNSWYLKVPYYGESGSLCFSEQISLNLFNFSSNFSIFSYKTPFFQSDNTKKIENIYRTESKFETNHFKIGISALFNNNRHIISRENKILSPCTQIKSNFQYNIEFGKNKGYAIKAGTTFFGNISANENAEDDMKFGISYLSSFPVSSVLLECNLSYKFHEDTKNIDLKFISANIENSWKIGAFTPSIGINSQYYIKSENENIICKNPKNYKINVGFNLFNNIITNSNSFSFSVKENEFCNKKLNSSLNINFSYKKLLISGKIALEFYL